MKGTFCGVRRTGIAMLVFLFVLVAPAAALAGVAGSDVSVSAPAAVSTATAAVPTVPAVPAAPAVAAAADTAAAAAATATSFPAPRLTIPVTAKVAVTPHKVKATVAARVTKPAAVKVARIVAPKAHATLHVKVAAKSRMKVTVPSVVIRKLAATPQCPPSDTSVHCVNQPWDDPATPNSCNGDVVHTMGTFQYYIKSSFDPISMTLTTFERSNFQNVSGVVTESPDPTNIGNPYQANDTDKTYQNIYPVPVGGFTFSTQHDENNELISKGPDPNQIIHVKTNTTVVVDPTATPPVSFTVSVSGPGLKCTG